MLKNKTILVTGGTGILGEACVRHALQEQARVFFTFHSNREKARALEKAGAFALRCDFSSPKNISSLISALSASFSALDVLINNAALVRDHTIANLDEQDWDLVMSVNVRSVIKLCYALKPLLKNGNSKKVFNIISRVGMLGGFGQANYAASKDALIEFTKSLSVEWGCDGIAVNGINPGFMDSTMTRAIPDTVRALQKEKSVLKTFSDPCEVAAFIMYLCSENCSRVSGQIFHYETRIAR